MKNLSLDKYSPLISSQEVGEEIHKLLTSELDQHEVIELDLKSIKTMATFCAKQIFGQLYVKLTAEIFFERIKLINVNEDLQMIIRLGILSAIKNE